MLDAQTIFARYQSIRPRLPQATFDATTLDVQSLLDIRDEVDAFVFDAFGVLNVGETPIPGAAARLDELRASGHQIRILSNAASYNHQGATAKFQKLGIQVGAEEIVTSRDAALANLNDVLWGCIASPSDDLTDIPTEVIRLDTDRTDFDRADGFLFLSTETWQESQQEILRDSLVSNPRPVMIANADLAAPRDFGFSLEPGHFGHLLADDGLPDIRFFGKPFPEVFEITEASLQGISPERIAMCGDTLHTDTLGAAARGWRTVLVAQDGVFSGLDTRTFCEESNLIPTWRLQRI
ncbi:MAG: HAD-IIA family hydrolase [Cognatishimia activa]